MTRLTITGVQKYFTNKEGKNYTSQYSHKDQVNIVLTTQEEGKCSAFIDADHPVLDTLIVGAVVDCFSTKINGKFKNLVPVKKDGGDSFLAKEVTKLAEKVQDLIIRVEELKAKNTSNPKNLGIAYGGERTTPF